MKRLTLLAVAMVMILGMAASASAAPEVTISGNVLVNAVWRANWDFADDFPGDTETQALRIQERADLYFTATANENLKAVLGFRSVRGTWGQAGMANDASGGGATNTIDLRDAYIDFNWPGTSVNVKAGLQPITFPGAVGGSFIQDARATAVLVSTAFTDNVSMLAGWHRLYDSNVDGAFGANDPTVNLSEVDAWLLAMPLSFEGVSATPFFAYAPMGENAVNTIVGSPVLGTDPLLGLLPQAARAGSKVDDAWWLGTDFELSMLDPFIIKADINYGQVSGNNASIERSGWLFDIALDYTGFDFMDLSLAYAYTTGEDDDDLNGSERLPVLVEGWALGSFFFGAGLITGDDLGGAENLGFHAVALSATGIQSFAEGLTHDAHIVYAKGTNDKDSLVGYTYGETLTEEDSMWEVDFNTMYKIYDELTLYNGIGYINLDYDDDVWFNNAGGDAWKFQVGMVYQF